MALANLDLVEMWPNDLTFHGRFKKVNKKRIIILNLSPMEIAFKASDTMPDSIRLVPEYGYISPKERAIITVTILPLNSVPSKEDVTICLSPAPENKTNAFWSNENSWPEESRTTNLIVKFVENDEESTCSVSSSSSESEEEESSSSDNEQLVANSSSSSDQESSESVEGEDDSESESPSKPANAKSSEN